MFLIMCEGGCGGYGPVIAVIRGMSNIIKILFPIFALIMCLLYVIKWYRGKLKITKQELRKKIIRKIVFALIVFVVCEAINLYIDSTYVFDHWADCWCG